MITIAVKRDLELPRIPQQKSHNGQEIQSAWITSAMSLLNQQQKHWTKDILSSPRRHGILYFLALDNTRQRARLKTSLPLFRLNMSLVYPTNRTTVTHHGLKTLREEEICPDECKQHLKRKTENPSNFQYQKCLYVNFKIRL